MPRRHYPPAHLRYLKARLWNLSRPSFWGAAIFLSVVGLTIKEYWANPNFFTDWQKNQIATNQPDKSSLSKEDRAIVADIDNLPVLLNTDSDKENSQPATTTKPTQNTQGKNNRGSLLEALNKSKSQTSATDEKLKTSLKEADSASAPKLENPFVAQAENLLQLKNFQTGKNSQGINPLTPSFGQQNPVKNSFGLDLGLPDATKPNQNIVSESALQTVLNQSNNQNQPNLNGTISTQKNLFEQSQLSNQNRTGQIVPSIGLSPNTINPNTGKSSPQSGLIPGTGYIQPPLRNGVQNSIPGTGYIQPQVTNGLQNLISGTNYPQPGFNNLIPQNPISGIGYPQPGFNNLIPQNPISGTSYPQPGFNNLIPQNPTSGAGYLQTQPAVIGKPQTPSAVPNRSAIVFDEMMRNRLNNVNTGQPLPSVAQPTSVILPSPATSTRLAPDYNPNQGRVLSNTLGNQNNYGNSGLQQYPASVPPYNYSSPQVPGQYTGGGQINRY